MDTHAEVRDLIGAWALAACDADEAAAVAAHLDECTACAAEGRRLRSAVDWLGADRAAPPALRGTVLSAARARRTPSVPRTLAGAYARQVAVLDDLLDGISPGDWLRPHHKHGTVGGVVAHLAGNDAMLGADLGLPVVPLPSTPDGARLRAAWREQARLLVDGLAACAAPLDLPVRLASSGPPPRGPLRDALVQRAFETWTHHDDIAAAVGREPATPGPEQVRRIVDLAVRLLPGALAARGRSRPDRCARLALAGPAGGEWTVPLGGAGPVEAEPDVTIFADAVEFTRLVANRRTPQSLRHRVTGDEALAAAVLPIAATLGCD
jgi:uncharacterized protein (TIGR03083 family)